MKSLPRLLALFMACASLVSAATPSPVAFVDVTVVPMDSERVLPRHTVVVSGDRITHLGPTAEIKIPDGARRIEASGKYLMPGIGEMHGHNPPLGSSQEYIENVYFLFIANGVTTVRGMLGWPGQLELRDKVNKGELVGPWLYLAGPAFNGQTATAPGQAADRVREQKKEGWDLLKVQPGMRRDVYDAMARTADELGIRFAGHVPADVGLAHAIARKQETIDHLDGYIEHLQAETAPVDRAKLEQVTKLTRDTRTAVVPTMVLWETIIGAADAGKVAAFPELKYMPKAEVARWKTTYAERVNAPNFDKAKAAQIAANRKVVLKSLADGGAAILFGTDAPQQYSVPGFSIHREMKAMAEAGLSNYAILASATKNVGEHLKAKDTFGLVATGHRADLILLDANPLADVGNVAKRSGVMVRGRWFPEAEIQAKLAQIAAASAN